MCVVKPAIQFPQKPKLVKTNHTKDKPSQILTRITLNLDIGLEEIYIVPNI